MRTVSILSLLMLAFVSAGRPASAQYYGGFGQVPGVLVDRIITLSRPVDVALQGVPVQEAAQALTHASRVPILVDPQVAADTRVSITARGVPLGMLLEALARQTNLFIAPLPHAMRLVPPPSLAANGQAIPFAAPFAPWTNEWGLNPAASPFTIAGESLSVRGGGAIPSP
jgi:hypothetical protein